MATFFGKIMQIDELDYDKLSKLNIFLGLSIIEIKDAIKCLNAHIKTFSDGERVYSFGEKIDEAGIVLKGAVIFKQTQLNGDEIIFTEFRENMFFGTTCCFAEKMNSSMLSLSHGETEVLFLRISDIYTNPNCAHLTKVMANITTILARNFYQLSMRMKIISQTSLRNKILLLCKVVISELHENPFKLDFSREQMANYLNADRTALCREMGKMQKDNLIKIEGKKITLLTDAGM